MNSLLMGVVLLAAAVWVLRPDPHHRLHRLVGSSSTRETTLTRLARGRKGAVPLSARTLVGLSLGTVLFALLAAPLGAWALAIVPLVVVFGGGQLRFARKSISAAEVELAGTVELLAVCLAAGSPMRHALEVVGGVSGPVTTKILARVSGQLAMGLPEQQAWQDLLEDDVWGQVARDVARSATSGTSLVEVLQVHADEARLVAEEKAQERARTAGVRSVVPLMVCFLPAFVLVGVVPIIAGLLEGFLAPGR